MKIFGISDASTNEELIKVLKAKNIMLAAAAVIGIAVIIGVNIYAASGGGFVGETSSYFYTGAGSGLAFAGIFMMIKNCSVMKNDSELTKLRIFNTDERSTAIRHAALRAAAAVLVSAVCIILFVSGFVALNVTKTMYFLLVLFFFSDIVFKRIYSSQM